MPRLLLFVPCHRAVIDFEDNSLSIHELLEGIRVTVPSNVTVDPGTTVPQTWFAVAVWYREVGDSEHEYEQRVQLLDPQGEMVVQGISRFEMNHRSVRTRTQFNAFPITLPGEYMVKLDWRQAETEVWNEATSYPITLDHLPGDPIPLPVPETAPARQPRRRRSAGAVQAEQQEQE